MASDRYMGLTKIGDVIKYVRTPVVIIPMASHLKKEAVNKDDNLNS